MILVTEAGGQVGKAVVKTFAEKGIDVCAMVHREITAEYISDQAFLDGLKKSGASEYKQDMMIKMFHHYNDHDFIGNARVLTSFPERKPHTLLEYFQYEGKKKHA